MARTVPGNAWTGAHSWEESWYGTANAVVKSARIGRNATELRAEYGSWNSYRATLDSLADIGGAIAMPWALAQPSARSCSSASGCSTPSATG